MKRIIVCLESALIFFMFLLVPQNSTKIQENLSSSNNYVSSKEIDSQKFETEIIINENLKLISELIDETARLKESFEAYDNGFASREMKETNNYVDKSLEEQKVKQIESNLLRISNSLYDMELKLAQISISDNQDNNVSNIENCNTDKANNNTVLSNNNQLAIENSSKVSDEDIYDELNMLHSRITSIEELLSDVDDRMVLISNRQIEIDDFIKTIDNKLSNSSQYHDSQTQLNSKEEIIDSANDQQIISEENEENEETFIYNSDSFTEVFDGDIITLHNAEEGKTYYYKIFLYAQAIQCNVPEEYGNPSLSFFFDQNLTIEEDFFDNHTATNVDGWLYICLIPESSGMLQIHVECIEA